MKKLINVVENILYEQLEGMALAHPQLIDVHFDPHYIVRRQSPVPGKVAIVSGGGSGHEPMHGGFVGYGMLDGACPGAIFTSPTPDQILACGQAAHGGGGLLLVVKNYTGDVLSFETAAELLHMEGIRVRTVLVDDDYLRRSITDPTSQVVDGLLAIRHYHPTAPLLHEVESLLQRATANDPTDRPQMSEVATELREWLKRSASFQHTSLGDWKHVQTALFPLSVPSRAEWRDLPDVIGILNLLAENAKLNHAFAPEGGGLDLSGAVPSHEVGYVELRFETSIAVVAKVERLLFESFPGADDWAYFRLECAPIPPSGTYESVAGRFEELLELSPGKYCDRSLYEQGFVSRDPNSGEPIPLPKSARVVSRLLGGAFVVFAKASGFNAADSYQGMHDRLQTLQRRVIADDHRAEPLAIDLAAFGRAGKL